ncbi:MAG: hypothetical protein QGG26_14600 [Candidatus Undinarchaeales archaeon]|nr:hypothetical protein [Candidatus Undinarchaeales archaeon]
MGETMDDIYLTHDLRDFMDCNDLDRIDSVEDLHAHNYAFVLKREDDTHYSVIDMRDVDLYDELAVSTGNIYRVELDQETEDHTFSHDRVRITKTVELERTEISPGRSSVKTSSYSYSINDKHHIEVMNGNTLKAHEFWGVERGTPLVRAYTRYKPFMQRSEELSEIAHKRRMRVWRED